MVTANVSEFSCGFLSNLERQALEDLFVILTRRSTSLSKAYDKLSRQICSQPYDSSRTLYRSASKAHRKSMKVHTQWQQVVAELRLRDMRWPKECYDLILG